MAIDRNERAARYQSLFREVNERVVELEQDGLQEVFRNGDRVYAVCECANAGCHEPIDLSVAEYKAIRSSPIRFLINAGHEWPDVKDLVAEHDGYVVVEDWRGRDRNGARATQNRGRAVTRLRLVDGSWPAEELEVLRGLRESLHERVEDGDLRARPALQVVVAFISELEGPTAAGMDA